MIATTGFFDGVHLGHRLVIERLVSIARERGDESLVVTFWPHPRAVLQNGARDLRLLTALEEKKTMLLDLGVDSVVTVPFTRDFAALTAEQFLRDKLQAQYGVTTLLMGYDNRLGSDRLTVAQLFPIAESMGMELVEVEPFGGRETDQLHISSTSIRKVLEKGEVERAAEMLGYGYSLTGVVVAGNRLGRTIGFPTANLKLYEPLKLVPGRGVYLVDVEVLGQRWRGMTNIGLRPTVGGTYTTIETHILDFDEDIYGLPLTVTFLRRLRDEIHFASLEELRSRLEKDREICRLIK